MTLAAWSAGATRGELAALATAFCWTLSALAFASAARRLGSLPLNLVRLLMALVLLAVWGGLTRGHPLPTDAGLRQWPWLGLSGLVGFTLGDLCLFRAFVLIGPRVTMLVMALVPVLTALAGWLVLGEGMTPRQVAGMVVTVTGVAWVVLERRPPGSPAGPPISPAGVLLALGAAAGQALGLVLAKRGMDGYDAFASTQVRAAAGVAGFLVLFCVLRAWPRFVAALRHAGGLGYAAVGAVFGPFLGVSLMLTAVAHTQAGLAATLASIVPVLIIPFAVVLHRERVGPRAVGGAVLAVGGVALLLLWT